MRLLIVEDDTGVSSALASALSMSGHVPTRISRGTDALIRYRDYEMLILDLGLPDIDGFELLTRLRAVSTVPIIVLTGRHSERDVVRALHLGADDYLVKPPRLSELLARIDVIARRWRVRLESPPAPLQVQAQGITVDLAARTVCRDGTDVPLTRTEFEVLAVLCERPGEAVSREQILDRVWGDTFASTSRSLSVHLTQLRAKLQRPGLVTTIRGHGYRFG